VAAGGEVGGGGEVGAVAGLDGFAGQPDGEVVLPTPGGPMSSTLVADVEVAAGREVGDQLAVGAGLGVVVEVLQGGRGG
jgi:hypothetical protein